MRKNWENLKLSREVVISCLLFIVIVCVTANSELVVSAYMNQTKYEPSDWLSLSPPQASQIQDVYQLKDLAPDDFLAQMQEAAEALLCGQDPGPK